MSKVEREVSRDEITDAVTKMLEDVASRVYGRFGKHVREIDMRVVLRAGKGQQLGFVSLDVLGSGRLNSIEWGEKTPIGKPREQK